MVGCRSSGVLTASAIVSGERSKLISIHAQLTGTNPTLVRVFDNTAASGKELARINLVTSKTDTIEFDMHGVISTIGLYLDIATGSGLGAAVSIEFS